MTESPSGFRLDADNCYVMSFVGIGQISSMPFNEEGTFDYVVKAVTGIKEKGTIIGK